MTIELFGIFLWRIFNLPNSNFGAKNQDVLQREFLDKNKNFRVECISLPLFINSKKLFLVCPWNWRFFSQQKWANWGSYCDTKSFKHVLGGCIWHEMLHWKLKYVHERAKECLWDANNILYFFLWRSNQVK